MYVRGAYIPALGASPSLWHRGGLAKAIPESVYAKVTKRGEGHVSGTMAGGGVVSR